MRTNLDSWRMSGELRRAALYCCLIMLFSEVYVAVSGYFIKRNPQGFDRWLASQQAIAAEWDRQIDQQVELSRRLVKALEERRVLLEREGRLFVEELAFEFRKQAESGRPEE